MKDHDKLREIIHSLLEEIGEDPTREGLLKTPSRVASSWRFFSEGYGQNLDDIINNATFHEEAAFASITCFLFSVKLMLAIYRMEK